MYFGFTGLAQHFNESKKQALRSVPESRLLVETDSPYFKIGGTSPCSGGDDSKDGGRCARLHMEGGSIGVHEQCEGPV